MSYLKIWQRGRERDRRRAEVLLHPRKKISGCDKTHYEKNSGCDESLYENNSECDKSHYEGKSGCDKAHYEKISGCDKVTKLLIKPKIYSACTD